MYEGETERIPRVTDDSGDSSDDSGHDDPAVELPHGHGHGHTPAPPASRRVRTIIAILLIPFALAAAVGVVLLYPFGFDTPTRGGAGTPVDGVVTAAATGSCNGDVQVGDKDQGRGQCLVVNVRMTDGAAPNQEIRTLIPIEPATPRFAVGDEVVLAYSGSNPTDGASYQLVDFQRGMPLALLAGLFALAVLVLGRWQGLKALIALGISFLVIVLFVLPAILAGESPLLVAVVGAGVIMFVVLYLTHGLSARTSTAVLGTMMSLTLIGVLGALWAAFAKLTGIDEDTSTLVGLLNHPIDTRGLLLAGVVIGALGVLDDVTVTQTSAVWELRAANPSLTRRQLYAAALRIGRDHVASAVNTLVMAYAGAALPLLLYSTISGVGIGNILGSQSIAQEIVRTLVGSVGIVAAVPVTTALAAAVAAQEPAGTLAGMVAEPEPAKRSGAAKRDRVDRAADRAADRGRVDRVTDRPDRSRAGTRDRVERRRDDQPEDRRDGQRARGQSRERAADRSVERAERTRDQAGDRSSERSRERAADRSVDRVADRAADRARSRSPERAAERSADRAANRSVDRTADRARSRSSESAAERSADRAADPVDRAADRARSRSPEQAAERSADRAADSQSGRRAEQAAERQADRQGPRPRPVSRDSRRNE